MTDTTYPEARLAAEDLEFVVHRAYLARHACGVVITGTGGGMHEAMLAHTAECEGNPA
jgi:hypothetical protein